MTKKTLVVQGSVRGLAMRQQRSDNIFGRCLRRNIGSVGARAKPSCKTSRAFEGVRLAPRAAARTGTPGAINQARVPRLHARG
jgi:hypothetical protein